MMDKDPELLQRLIAAWADATDPDIPDAHLTPYAKAMRHTSSGQRALLHAHLYRSRVAIHDALPRPLQRFFDWYGRLLGR